MLRLLLPVDGSEPSLRPIDHLIGKLGWYREPPEIHLINVQPALPSHVTQFISRDEMRKYHDEEGMKALAAARAKLDAAGLRHDVHIGTGDEAETIARYSKDNKIDLILLGTRALGPMAGMLLGSVATKIIRETDTPVLLVK